MLVKADGTELVRFPYNLHDLFEEHPNTTFPRPMTDEVLESYGIFRVVDQDVEFDDATQTVQYASVPTLVDGVWTITAEVVTRTQEDLDAREEGQATYVRSLRNDLLAETDWWAVSDRTMTAAETTYRQALRDLPTHANWPYLEDADWPTKPE